MTPTSRWKVSYTQNLVGAQDRFWGLVTHSEVMNEPHKKALHRTPVHSTTGNSSSTQQFADCIPVPRAQVEKQCLGRLETATACKTSEPGEKGCYVPDKKDHSRLTLSVTEE